MRILPLSRGGALLCFWLSLVLTVGFCYADSDKTVEVVGIGECSDCTQNNFDTKQAFSGLRVTIDCKAKDGNMKTRGSGELDEEGKFKVSVPNEIVKEGKLNEECYAQLHSASAGLCPAHDGLESSKIVSQDIKTDGKQSLGLAGKLKFSPVTCASTLFWHHFHKNHPFFPPKKELPSPSPKKEFPPPAPKGEPKPCPPKTPAPKKELPPYPPKKEKPYTPAPVPVKKPCPPKKEKPYTPAPVPVFKKPPAAPVPVYKPKHPFYKHPFFEHPFFKHLPSFPKIKIPPHHPLFPKLPPFQKINHKFFDHPKQLDKVPSLPPFDPHHHHP